MLGEGSIGDSVAFALIGLTLGNSEVLYWLAWIALFWSAWRFWVANPIPFYRLEDDINKSMEVTTGRLKPSILALAGNSLEQIDGKFYRLMRVQLDGLDLKLHINLVAGNEPKEVY